MPIAYVGLGSNIGDKSKNIQTALELLDQSDTIEVVKTSSFYETEPVGYENQDWFVNAVAELETNLSPQELLNTLLRIEQDMGRKRDIRWGPRVIDLDLLLYDQLCLDTPDLVIPHPRMHERAFVLVPLAEIAFNIIHPLLNKTIGRILEEFNSSKTIRLFE